MEKLLREKVSVSEYADPNLLLPRWTCVLIAIGFCLQCCMGFYTLVCDCTRCTLIIIIIIIIIIIYIARYNIIII